MTYKAKYSRFVKALINITPYKSKDNKKYYIAMGRDISESLELQKNNRRKPKQRPADRLDNKNIIFVFIERIYKKGRIRKPF